MVRKRNRDWFSEQDEHIEELLLAKRRAIQAVLSNPSPAARKAYALSRSEVQRVTRIMKNELWCKLAAEIQGYADTGDQRNFYSTLKAVYGPRSAAQYPVRNKDGTELLTSRVEILRRWAEYYS